MGKYNITSFERKLIHMNSFLIKETERAFSEGFKEGSCRGCDENEAFNDFMVELKTRIAEKEKEINNKIDAFSGC